MKTLGVSILLSVAAVQVSLFGNQLRGALDAPEFASLALTLLVMAYHIGVWRQRVDSAKNGFAAELEQFRRETNARFDRLMDRLEAIERQLAAFQDYRAAGERWQGGVESKLEAMGGRFDRLEGVGA